MVFHRRSIGNRTRTGEDLLLSENTAAAFADTAEAAVFSPPDGRNSDGRNAEIFL